MCFSATASLTATGILSILGLATFKQISSKRELLLGLFPCLFATQQFLEGLVWLSLDNYSLAWLNATSTYGFLLFATAIWLIISPISVYLLEHDQLKRKIILLITGLGVILGIYLFISISIKGISPQIFSGNLLYDLRFIPFYQLAKYLYLLIIVVPFFLASANLLKVFGVLIIFSFVIAQIFYNFTFVSVWCFFAALLSSAVYFILKNYKSEKLIAKNT